MKRFFEKARRFLDELLLVLIVVGILCVCGILTVAGWVRRAWGGK